MIVNSLCGTMIDQHKLNIEDPVDLKSLNSISVVKYNENYEVVKIVGGFAQVYNGLRTLFDKNIMPRPMYKIHIIDVLYKNFVELYPKLERYNESLGGPVAAVEGLIFDIQCQLGSEVLNYPNEHLVLLEKPPSKLTEPMSPMPLYKAVAIIGENKEQTEWYTGLKQDFYKNNTYHKHIMVSSPFKITQSKPHNINKTKQQGEDMDFFTLNNDQEEANQSDDNLFEEQPSHHSHTLAPAEWDDYIGQSLVKRQLQVAIQGALSRHDRLPNTMLLGPPGLGKTSLCELIAKEMGVPLHVHTIGPTTNMQKLLSTILNMDEGGVFFIDELHGAPKRTHQHLLLEPLENRRITLPSGKVETIPPMVSFVAATTDEDLLLPPLRDRWMQRYTLEYYSKIEMAKIIERMFIQLDIQPTMEICLALADASLGTPRQARRLVYASRDLGNPEDITDILLMCDVTRSGLTKDHIIYLRSLYKLGYKAGLSNLITHSQRPKAIIENLERVLSLRGLIEITPSGRVLTRDGALALKTGAQELKMKL